MTGSAALAHIHAVRTRAELVFSPREITAAMDAMAGRIGDRLRRADPLLLGVMVGGTVPLAMLLTRLDFPLEVDYVHATRYRGTTEGGVLHWLRAPQAERVRERTVLLVDDVLDAGLTLAAIAERCRELGAREVLTAVLVSKRIASRTALPRADFSALESDDRYLFGYGMDYHGYLRNAPGIFAVQRT